MKKWQESSAILDHLLSISDAGEQAAVALLIRIEGSSYRRPGAKLLVGSDGSSRGSISGGCLEEDVRQNAQGVIRDGGTRRLRYKTGSDDETVWGLGLGCDGVIDLFLYAATLPPVLETIATQRELFQGDRPFAVATVVEAPPGECNAGRVAIIVDGAIVAGGSGDPEIDACIEQVSASALGMSGTGSDASVAASGLHIVEGAEIFIETHSPPPYLLVFGGGDDAIPLLRLAADVGFRVVVVDHRAGYLTDERFPEAWRLVHVRDAGALADLPCGESSYAVVKTHSLNRDSDWVRALSDARLPYIGLLGPRDRRQEILAELSEEQRRNVYGPVGLDLGSEGPEQVALSIVAELLAVVSGRGAGHLRDTGNPIHAEPNIGP